MILPLDSNAGNSLLDTYHCRQNIDFAFMFVPTYVLLFKICFRIHEIPSVNPIKKKMTKIFPNTNFDYIDSGYLKNILLEL